MVLQYRMRGVDDSQGAAKLRFDAGGVNITEIGPCQGMV